MRNLSVGEELTGLLFHSKPLFSSGLCEVCVVIYWNVWNMLDVMQLCNGPGYFFFLDKRKRLNGFLLKY